jgi:hypothetical protein
MYIDPFKTEDVSYWSRKWHITPTELFTAIMNTGSNHIQILGKSVKRKSHFEFIKAILHFGHP